MMYPQIIFHCIDDEMMDFDNETLFRSSVGCLMLWVVRLVSVKKLTYIVRYILLVVVLESTPVHTP